MKAYSGSTSEGFAPASMPGTTPANAAVAPAPEDPSATFNDFLQQQAGNNPAAPTPWTDPATEAEPMTSSAWIDADLANGLEPQTLTPTPAASFFGTSAASLNWAKLSGTPTPTWSAPATGATATPLTTGMVKINTTAGDNMPSSEDGITQLPTLTKPATPIFSTPSQDDEKNADSGSSASSFSRNGLADSTSNPAVLFFMTARSATSPTPPPPITSSSADAKTPANSFSRKDPADSSSNPAPLFFMTAPAATSPIPPPPITKSNTGNATTSAAPSAEATSTTGDTLPTRGALPLRPASGGSTVSPFSGFSSPLFNATKQSVAAAPDPDAAADPKAPTPATISTTSDPSVVLPDSPLAMLLAQATGIAADAHPQPATGTARPAPSASSSVSSLVSSGAAAALLTPVVQGSRKTGNAAPATEKKYPVSASGRSFLQAAGEASPTTDATSLLLASASAASFQASSGQSVTASKSAPDKSGTGLVSSASPAAGTTNDKKSVDMNASLEMPGLIANSGINPLVAKTSADVHILLGTNNDFHEAIDQVLHVAELSNLSATSNPLRVAIEIQTPPGAIVSVYVSRQADSSYRAQLSTNDAQALSWVQDQIGSLKSSTSTGTDIRWAPAQLETGTTAANTASSSNGGNLDWNRDGNQGGDQSPDERPARSRPTFAPDEDEAEFGIPFLEAMGAIGSVA
jgi:hypothetical protein